MKTLPKKAKAVYAVIKKIQQFLMVKRKDWSLSLPGGRVKKGKILLQALKRELCQEEPKMH